MKFLQKAHTALRGKKVLEMEIEQQEVYKELEDLAGKLAGTTVDTDEHTDIIKMLDAKKQEWLDLELKKGKQLLIRYAVASTITVAAGSAAYVAISAIKDNVETYDQPQETYELESEESLEYQMTLTQDEWEDKFGDK